MEIYKNKINNEFYIKIKDLPEEDSMKALSIKDKYTYTIPIKDMDFWLDERVIETYK